MSYLSLLRWRRLQLKGGKSFGNILNSEPFSSLDFSIGEHWKIILKQFLVVTMCVNWRRGFWTYRKCEICIRCVCSSSWKWLLQICSATKNLDDILFAVNHVSPHQFCWLSNSSFWMQDDFVKVWSIAGVNTNRKRVRILAFLLIMLLRGTAATLMALYPAVIQIWLCLPMHWERKQSLSLSVLKMLGRGVRRCQLILLHSLRFQRSFTHLTA